MGRHGLRVGKTQGREDRNYSDRLSSGLGFVMGLTLNEKNTEL